MRRLLLLLLQQHSGDGTIQISDDQFQGRIVRRKSSLYRDRPSMTRKLSTLVLVRLEESTFFLHPPMEDVVEERAF